MVIAIFVVLLIVGLVFILLSVVPARTSNKDTFHPIARIDSVEEGVLSNFDECSASSREYPAFYYSEGMCKSLSQVPNVSTSQLTSKFPNLFVRATISPKIRDSVFIDIITSENTLSYTIQQSVSTKPVFTRIYIPKESTVNITNEGNLKPYWNTVRKLGASNSNVDAYRGGDAYICYL